MAVLLLMKWKEGRMVIPGRTKRAGATDATDSPSIDSGDDHLAAAGQDEKAGQTSSKKGSSQPELPTL